MPTEYAFLGAYCMPLKHIKIPEYHKFIFIGKVVKWALSHKKNFGPPPLRFKNVQILNLMKMGSLGHFKTFLLLVIF